MIYILLHSSNKLAGLYREVNSMKNIIKKLNDNKDTDWVIGTYNTWTVLSRIGVCNQKADAILVKKLITNLTSICKESGNIHFDIINTMEDRIHVYNDQSPVSTDPNCFCNMGYTGTLPGQFAEEWINYLTPSDRSELFAFIYGNILSTARIVLYHKKLIVTPLEDFALITGCYKVPFPKYISGNTIVVFNGENYYFLLRSGRNVVVDCGYAKNELRISPYYVITDYLKTCRQYAKETRKVVYRHDPIDYYAIAAIHTEVLKGMMTEEKPTSTKLAMYDMRVGYDSLYGNFLVSTDIKPDENVEGFMKLRLLHSGEYRRLTSRPNLNRVDTLLRKIFETHKSLNKDDVLEISKYTKESPTKLLADLKKEVKAYKLESIIDIGENIDQESLFDKDGEINVSPLIKYAYSRPASDDTSEGGK